MNTSNSPEAAPEYQAPKKNSKNAIIVVLALAFAGTWGYLLIHNNSTGRVIEQNQTQIAKAAMNGAISERALINP